MLIESFVVVTRGPELIAGSIPIFRNKNGRNSPKVVATMIAENIPVPNAITIRTCPLNGVAAPSRPSRPGKYAQITAPIIPQLIATNNAIRDSRANTWLNRCAARCPVANPQTTIADVCNPALPLIAAIIGTNATAAA